MLVQIFLLLFCMSFLWSEFSHNTLQHFKGVKMLKAGHGKHNIFIDLQIHIYICVGCTHRRINSYRTQSWFLSPPSYQGESVVQNTTITTAINTGSTVDQSITQQWHGAQVHSIAENFKIFIQEAFLVGYFSLFAFVITQITNVWHHCTWQEVTIITQHAIITEHHIKIKIIKMINDTIQQLLELLMRFSWIMLQSIFLFFPQWHALWDTPLTFTTINLHGAVCSTWLSTSKRYETEQRLDWHEGIEHMSATMGVFTSKKAIFFSHPNGLLRYLS